MSLLKINRYKTSIPDRSFTAVSLLGQQTKSFFTNYIPHWRQKASLCFLSVRPVPALVSHPCPIKKLRQNLTER